MVLDGPGRGHPEYFPAVRALEPAAKLAAAKRSRRVKTGILGAMPCW